MTDYMIRKKNIIFILADDQGAWAMGCAGNKDIKTPNLDSLAKEGIIFDQFHCASPVCSPARASIITGQIPSAHGIQDWISGGNLDAWKYPQMSKLEDFNMQDRAIDYLKGKRTYIDVLEENGYVCGLSGKWHLGDNASRKSGFSKWYTIGRGGCHYYKADICDEGEMYIGEEYITDLITKRAIQYIEDFSSSASPFYLSIHYTAPHSPWDACEHPKEFLDLYKECDFSSTPNLPLHPRQINTCPLGDTWQKRKENLTGYYAAISAMDAGIGKIKAFLEERELLENTVLIFTADNGMNMGHHGIWGKGNGTYPPNMFESSIKVPFILRLPEEKYRGRVCHEPLSQYDIFPTILDLAECNYDLSPLQPGESLLPYLSSPSKKEGRDLVIFDEYGKTRMIKKDGYKYIHHYGENFHELYSLKDDPEENENLYGKKEYWDLINLLKEEMEAWFQKYSVLEYEGIKHPVRGRGQKDICNRPNAFDQSYIYVSSKADGEEK